MNRFRVLGMNNKSKDNDNNHDNSHTQKHMLLLRLGIEL